MAGLQCIKLALLGGASFLAQISKNIHAPPCPTALLLESGDAPVEMRLLRVFLWRKLMGWLPTFPFSKQLVSAL